MAMCRSQLLNLSSWSLGQTIACIRNAPFLLFAFIPAMRTTRSHLPSLKPMVPCPCPRRAPRCRPEPRPTAKTRVTSSSPGTRPKVFPAHQN
ncbi:hypothetical protein M3J09_010854 [Ascochyta lentis]